MKQLKRVSKLEIKQRKEKQKMIWGKAVLTLVFVVLAVMFLLPFYWMVIGSIRPPREIFSAGLNLIPTKVTLESYVELFATRPYALWYFNSLLMLAGYALLALFTCALGGFALAKYEFRGRNFLFVLILCSQMIPFHLMLIPLFKILVNYRLIDTYWGVIIPLAAHPFGMFFMRQYMVGLSNDILEAARIDGTSEYQLFRLIVLPLIKPAVGTLAIFFGMEFWNNLLWPMIVLRSVEKFPLAVGIANLVGQHHPQYHLAMAASFLSVIPVLIIFLFFKNKFISGLAASGMVMEK